MTGMFDYWGKAKPVDGSSSAWHLLPFHSLDVAAAGTVYIERSPQIRALLQHRLGLPEAQLLPWIGFWLALHDLGKFATTFQGQREDILQRLQQRICRHQYSERHDTLGMLLWLALQEDAAAEAWFGPATDDLLEGLCFWARAMTGHHGQPPREFAKALDPHFQYPFDQRAAFEFVQAMRGMFLSDIDFEHPCFADPRRFLNVSRQLSWWLAGVAVLADWIGSNQSHFPYRSQAQDLTAYWQTARQAASRALSDVGVLPVPARPAMAFEQLFPHIQHPSPLQAWASQVALPNGAQIHLLEDVTGSGKTEAAMMLTHRLMSEGLAEGFYMGLPTMATANAMYGRLSTFYACLFDGMASLSLANGQRDLVAAFAESVLQPGQTERDGHQLDDTATARCTAWLADHNKRALLAPAGAGTIDQALMAVLQGKHQSLRLLGLFRKVVIVDEVHACDAYMQGVLEQVLRAHASVGGSAILLSATLPQRMKQALLDAFAEGGGQLVPASSETRYPLVTSWSFAEPGRIDLLAMPTRADVRRTVDVRYLADIDEVVEGIRAALAEGRCVCWMRNTVAEALDAHARFAAELTPDRLMLFHARFSLGDRLDMEGRILQHFGPQSTPSLRQGRLVIATQVAEQSLDADWDLVVSDLAPIDRLIQRAGRLQRHRRSGAGERLADPSQPDGRARACLWVHGPRWQESPSATWVKDAFPKSAKVYPHHGQLWLTARLLQEGQLRMPEDARRLIEGVFGQDAELPASLMQNAVQVEGKAMSEASESQSNTIKLASGYQRGITDWWDDARTPSRLGEPSVDVVLACWEGGHLRPWAASRPEHAWAYSTVRVPQRLIAEAAEPEDEAALAAWRQAQSSLPDQGKWSILLALQASDFGWRGAALMKQGDRQIRRDWVYDPLSGLKPLSS
ncbi:MAG: CRISPR-associated helicase Cas3' [Pseudomonadota bacterium]